MMTKKAYITLIFLLLILLCYYTISSYFFYQSPEHAIESREIKQMIEKGSFSNTYQEKYQHFKFIENNADNFTGKYLGDKKPIKMLKKELNGSVYYYSLINGFLDTEHFIIYDDKDDPVVGSLCDDAERHEILTCYCLEENKRRCEVHINR